MGLLFADIDFAALVDTIWISLIAGIGVTTLFSFVILGSARAGEARRSGQTAIAVGFWLVAALAGLGFAGAVVYAISSIVNK